MKFVSVIVTLLLAATLITEQAAAILLDPSSEPLVVEFTELASSPPSSCISTEFFGVSLSYVGLANGNFRLQLFDRTSGALAFDEPQIIEAGALRNSFSVGRRTPVPLGPDVTLRVTVEAGAADVDNVGLSVASCSQVVLLQRDTPDVIVLRNSIGQDTYIRQGAPNTNEGASEFLRIAADGKKRALIAFVDAAFNFIRRQPRTVESAQLRLNILDNGYNWGQDARTIDIHRLTAPWTEGNGRDADYDVPDSTRGDVPGATWSCASDSQHRQL